jgi:hypothetical protein
MPRPIVEIYQQVANVTITPANPTLPTCIVGPAYHLVQYPESNTSRVSYGTQGGWDDPFEVTTDGNAPARDRDEVAFSSFGLVPGTHAVDQDSVSVYLEDVYYAVKVGGNFGVSGCSVANSREVSTGDTNISNTTPSGGVKAGDRVILAPQMPQVLYDDNADSAFLSLVQANDLVTIATKTFAVAQVIDNNRLLLTDNVAGDLNNLAGVADPAALDYVVARDAVEIINVEDRGRRIKHTPVERVVQSVSSTTAFVLASDVKFKSGAGASSKISVRFERKLAPSTGATAPGHLVDSDYVEVDATSVTLGDALSDDYLKVTVGADEVNVMRASICLAARGLIVNLPEFLTFSEIPADLAFPSVGKIHPDNPLALALYVALSNSGGTTIMALCVPSDDAAGYSSVRSKLNSHDTVYCIVPLSTDLANVVAPYKNDAEAMSAPAKGKFRHVVAASAGLPSFKFVGPSEGGETGTGETTNGSTAFHDEGATFKTDGVVAGDVIVVTSTDGGATVLGTPIQYTVASVTNEQNIVLSANASASYSQLVYTVQRGISTNKDLQVSALLSRIASIASKRLSVVYPGSCKVLGYSGLSGVYVAAAVGAMVASLSPHRPKNNIGIAGIEQLYDSNLHFSYDQIDAISDGGYMVFIQDSVESLPYCVHQLTTAQITFPGVQEYCELSVVNNFDYVSKVFKNRLTPFVGSWNLIPEAFGSIRSTLESAIIDLKSRTESQIGAPLSSGKVDSIERSSSDSGTLVVAVGISIPKVLNRLQVFLESQ